MSDCELGRQYMPRFYQDTKEPFRIMAVGYTVLRTSGKSPSSTRMLALHDGAATILEYAVFFDFDIQHMYDLEHVFVYLDADGKVVDVEASFHGRFFKSMFQGELEFEDQTHPVFYMQPGKHAMMPNPRFFYLYPELYAACNEQCGKDGFLVAPMFADRLKTDADLNAAVCRYLQKNFSFVPTMEFEPISYAFLVMPFSELYGWIIDRMRWWSARLKADEMDG